MSMPPAYSIHNVSVSESGDTYDLRQLITEDWAMSGFKSGGSLIWHRDGVRRVFDNATVLISMEHLRYMQMLVDGGRMPELRPVNYLLLWDDGTPVPTESQVMPLPRQIPRRP